MFQKEIGNRIRTVRKDRQLTSEMLAEFCDISAVYLRQIEAGMKMPSLPLFISLCANLQVSPNYLLMDVLGPNEAQDIEALAELWKEATPSQIKLVSTMLQSALDVMEEKQEHT